MKTGRAYALIFTAAAIASVAYIMMAVKPRAQVTALLPIATSVALNGTGNIITIVGANPSRRVIQICNPSSIIETIAPTGITVSSAAAGYTLPATASGVISCYQTPAGTSGAGSAWTAVSASGTPNITVFEYF